MVAKVTSYEAATGGNVVNDVEREYDDFALLYREYQEHSGAVDGNTLYVEYGYDETEVSDELTKGLRPKSVRYPNGRLVHYTYGLGNAANDLLNRLDAIKDDKAGTGNPGVPIASYTYLGLGTVVREDYEGPEVRLDLWGGTWGTYQGFDRFGRVVDHRWRDYGSPAHADRFLYGYDRAGNRTWKENDVAANLGTPVHLDELYGYDEVYRLIAADRGNLNGTHDAIVNGTEAFSQDWDLDATGNWDSFDEDADGNGTNDLVQTRDHNEVNETGTIAATTGTNWADPVHDRAGNMTSMPKPSDPANAITAKYDAWNHLVEVTDGGILVAKFRYDGDGRRILKVFDTDSPGDPDGLDTYEHVYLSGNQVIETREGTGATPAQAETLQPKYQNVWSPRYIDALILRDENTDTDGLCDDSRLFYLADANYNVTALVDTNGDVLERYLYSPYGEVTILDPDFTPDADGLSDYANTTLYTGRELDAATGLYHYRARYYHVGLGRFAARDPLEYRGGANLYLHVGDSPVGNTDPSGLLELVSPSSLSPLFPTGQIAYDPLAHNFVVLPSGSPSDMYYHLYMCIPGNDLTTFSGEPIEGISPLTIPPPQSPHLVVPPLVDLIWPNRPQTVNELIDFGVQQIPRPQGAPPSGSAVGRPFPEGMPGGQGLPGGPISGSISLFPGATLSGTGGPNLNIVPSDIGDPQRLLNKVLGCEWRGSIQFEYCPPIKGRNPFDPGD